MLGLRVNVKRLYRQSRSQSICAPHFCEKRPDWYPHNSISIGLQTKNSMAIDRAAAAELKSEEFFVCNPIVIEQSSILSVQPPKKVVHILGARLRAPLLNPSPFAAPIIEQRSDVRSRCYVLCSTTCVSVYNVLATGTRASSI